MKHPLFIILTFSLLFLAACSPTICTTPKIISPDGSCCFDKNNDTICDDQQDLDEPEVPRDAFGVDAVKEEPPPVEVEVIEEQPTEELVRGPIEPPLTTLLRSYGFHEEEYFLGGHQGQALIVLFGDYEDEFTQRFNNDVLPELLNTYGQLLTFVYKDFPKPDHPSARKAAIAARCAGEQGKYWAYHNALFDMKRITQSDFNIIAANLELDVPKFSVCFKKETYELTIEEDYEEGLSRGVSTIPFFFINDKEVIGLRDTQNFITLLDEELKFYIEQPDITEVTSSSSTTLTNIIHSGQAALDSTVEDSPFSDDSLDVVDGNFYLKVTDHTQGENGEQDEGVFNANIILTEKFAEKEYNIILRELILDDHTSGGVKTNFYYNGDTGGGTALLPRSFMHVYTWGRGDIYVDGELQDRDVLIEFYITNGIRQSGFITQEDPQDLEAYLYLPGHYAEQQSLTSFSEGFLYLLWENVHVTIT